MHADNGKALLPLQPPPPLTHTIPHLSQRQTTRWARRARASSSALHTEVQVIPTAPNSPVRNVRIPSSALQEEAVDEAALFRRLSHLRHAFHVVPKVEAKGHTVHGLAVTTGKVLEEGGGWARVHGLNAAAVIKLGSSDISNTDAPNTR